MEIIKVDDCIKSIKLEDNTILYSRTRSDCLFDENNDNKNEYHFEEIPYEIGQKINIDVYDKGDNCFFEAKVIINGHQIKTNDKKFWKCENCKEYLQNHVSGETKFYCYPHDPHKYGENKLYNFHYYFQIDSAFELPNMKDISEYYYYLNETNYFLFRLQI